MTLFDLTPLANHLWQSTAFAGVAWVLTLALKRNRAAVRHAVWMAASVKFLIPFSLLIGLGGHFATRTALVSPQPPVAVVMEEISQPFAVPDTTPPAAFAPPARNRIPEILIGLWLAGFLAAGARWSQAWRRVHAIRRSARPLDLRLPIPAMSGLSRMEPGLVGIWKPVLLLPDGIAERLTPAQLEAVIAHELCHLRRRDNLTGALHMLVETIFWFHPLVWWMGSRLVAERERACDEETLRNADPLSYAEGILEVCRLYAQAPAPAVSGISGADLRKRIESIMSGRRLKKLGFGMRILVAALCTFGVGAPITVGLLHPGLIHATASASLRPRVQPGAHRREAYRGPESTDESGGERPRGIAPVRSGHH